MHLCARLSHFPFSSALQKPVFVSSGVTLRMPQHEGYLSSSTGTSLRGLRGFLHGPCRAGCALKTPEIRWHLQL